MKRRKAVWNAGDVFGIPLADGKYLAGQVLTAIPGLGSASVALFDLKFSDVSAVPVLAFDKVFSILLTTRDSLDRELWKIVGSQPIAVPRSKFPYENLRAKGFVGAKITGSGIVAEFANAFCGLCVWDDWADPLYLDRLLVSADKKPAALKYKNPPESH